MVNDRNGHIPGGYYIKARCIQQSAIASAPPYVREIWDWLLMEANHRDVKYAGFFVKRGQLFRGYDDIIEGLSWRIGWRKGSYSKDHVKKAMKALRKHSMIATTKALGGVLITICNYDRYQNPQNYESTNESTTESTNEAPNHPHYNKNVKNDKNERKKKYLDCVLLTDQEYSKLVELFGEDGTKQKIDALNTGIMSKGYKYKSHYHTILNWERRKGGLKNESDPTKRYI